MGNRHLSRSIALQTLFEWDFNAREASVIEEIIERNVEEFAPGMADPTFIRDITGLVSAKQTDIDSIIEKAAPDWPIAKISIVDRNVLRIGLAELLFGDRKEVPAKVAINEAIELAKTFGGENSGRFVNGVLGAVYKEIGEPGKDEMGPRKGARIDPTKLPLEQLVGAVVYSRDGEEIYIGLVHDIFGRWTLSKGHLKEDEDVLVGVVRKVQEEMGATVTPGIVLGTNEYIASNPEKGKLRKRVTYYLAEAPYAPLTVGESGGLDDANWFKLADVVDLNMYDDILPIFTKAINILLGKEPAPTNDPEEAKEDTATSE